MRQFELVLKRMHVAFFAMSLAGLSIRKGVMTIAVTTHGGQAITTANALFPNASESEDTPAGRRKIETSDQACQSC